MVDTIARTSDEFAEAERVLKRVWGYVAFRPKQVAPLRAVLEGRDVLAVLPTGEGKSLLYQVPALVTPGLTLVVTPLVALMHDQVAHLKARRVPAALLDYSLSRGKAEQVLVNAQHGAYRLLYLSPERLETDLFQTYAPRLPVYRLAVDEAHCVSAWGRNFRPAYLRIAEARRLVGDVPLVAVTATATPEVRRDIVTLLGLRTPDVFVQGFDRPNITFEAERQERRTPSVVAAVRAAAGPSIVYVATRRSAETWHQSLTDAGLSAAFYHGGLDATARRRSQETWMRGEVSTIVATNAFGMGVDRPDVRLVVHAEQPGSLEAYYQEAGRAGRDGAPARALLLWSPRDVDTQKALITASHPTARQAAAVLDAVLNLAQVPVGEQPPEPLSFDADRVAMLAGVTVALVVSSLRLLERGGLVRLHTGVAGRGWLHVVVTPEVLRSFAETRGGRLGAFVAALARALPAEAFAAPVLLPLRPLARQVGLSPERLVRGLEFLTSHSLLQWRDGASPRLEVLVPRSKTMPVDDRLVAAARRGAEAGLRAMQAYARSPLCRRQGLLAYFGEAAPPCGRCDNCRAPAPIVTPADEGLLAALVASLAAGETAPDSPRTPLLLRHLVAEGFVAASSEQPLTMQLTAAGADWAARHRPAA
jgi:ATP-dependent DNA helicase RecQ